MKIRFIAGEPAVIIERKSKKEKQIDLIIADLHIGIEYEIGLEDVFEEIVRKQKMRIEKLIDENKADRLIILGDIKHILPIERTGWDRVANKAIREMIDDIRKKVAVFIIKGNHDGNIERFINADWIGNELIIGDVGITHGHTWPSEDAMKSKYLIIAHNHPAVSFEDEVGGRIKRKVWIIGTMKKAALKRYPKMNKNIQVVIAPAFNEFITGSRIGYSKREHIGPLMRKDMFKIGSAELYLLDGINIGKVGKRKK